MCRSYHGYNHHTKKWYAGCNRVFIPLLVGLALIKQEDIHQAGKYGRCTIGGDMDDIYADKESTDFVKAFHSLSRGMCVPA